ncbi:hypothetical protein F442_10713 [Phytophthora nicotianae P10297]|uniref:Uncharacterized protein n=5 Tax=Phytophthora nicotianae TaxID=4792 RepID=W2Q5Y5_PHYN3|nr:hypothetical protein PPTG_23107 [Phytophthora nicotianae INRA-310]ETI44489.1 hypothetical protein F443_10816 [Phytophthora nicotianae P1569]ETK84488.1 hypothetical protein L915_10558 [Phytophthora nicotianae]ETO73145.1 hypothetical protein F444_10892 [Phytophthora nicotianae P1976]ETP42376.1 hypothetical protein F442_10713 [Phytophthora nicotianae P10297]ETL37928.1 hypothetical protein L916_10447 [Phytophthora nicotianae]
MQLPREIHLVSKATTPISEFAMSSTEAVREAAATNQVQWLTELLKLPEFRGNMNETARNLTEIAAPEFDAYELRESLYYTMACAARKGHFDIVIFLNEKVGKELFREDESIGIEDGGQRGDGELNGEDNDDNGEKLEVVLGND